MNPLEQLKSDVRACVACSAREDARSPVPCAFPLGAAVPPPVLVVGRNPGKSEDYANEPFVGPAGRKLTEWLANAGLDREVDVVVTNLVKCFTDYPANREPRSQEVAACRTWLVRELQLFQPRLVIGLGDLVAKALSGKPIRDMAGVGVLSASPGVASVFYAHHPSAALRSAKMSNLFWAQSETLRAWIKSEGILNNQTYGEES